MTPATGRTGTAARDDAHDDVVYPSKVLFVAVHLACFAAFWSGVTVEALALGVMLYLLRMFAVTAGYHRYFSHRAFKTSRAFQFVLACLAQSSAQRGVLWWAGKHRWHHRHADTELDVHSPARHGFFHAHVGWIWAPSHHETDLTLVPDLARFPELVWLDRQPYLCAILLGIATYLVAGWPASSSASSGAPSPPGTRLSASIRWRTSRAGSATSRAMTPATIGGWPSSRWAKAGTTTITPAKRRPARASAGGSTTRPGTR